MYMAHVAALQTNACLQTVFFWHDCLFMRESVHSCWAVQQRGHNSNHYFLTVAGGKDRASELSKYQITVFIWHN